MVVSIFLLYAITAIKAFSFIGVITWSIISCAATKKRDNINLLNKPTINIGSVTLNANRKRKDKVEKTVRISLRDSTKKDESNEFSLNTAELQSQKNGRMNATNKGQLLAMVDECPTQEATANSITNPTQVTNSVEKAQKTSIADQKGPIIKPQMRVVKPSAIVANSKVSLNLPQKTLQQPATAIPQCIMDVKQEEMAYEMDTTQPLSDIKPLSMSARQHQQAPISPSSSTKKTSPFQTIEIESEKSKVVPQAKIPNDEDNITFSRNLKTQETTQNEENLSSALLSGSQKQISETEATQAE